MKLNLFLAASLIGVMVSTQPSLGYGNGGDADPSGDTPTAQQKRGPVGIQTKSGVVSLRAVSSLATKAITTRMQEAASLCRQLDESYYVDCLGERLESLAKELSGRGDYAEARKIILNSAKKLRRLAARNRDTSKARVKLPTPRSTTGKTTKPIVATKPAAAKKVRQQAEAIIAEAQTQLLRSAANSQKRKSHYEQIAAAMGSNSKVLLRSL